MKPGQIIKAKLVFASPEYLQAREAAGAPVVQCDLPEDLKKQEPGRFDVLPGDVPFVRGGFLSPPVPSGELPVECWLCGRTETWIEVPTVHGPEGWGCLGCPYCDE